MTTSRPLPAATAASIRLGALPPDRLEEAVALSRQAGWPHRREDWAMVLGLSRGFAAYEGERLVGTAMATPFGSDAATINMVLVAERLRGRGVGRQLMKAALEAIHGREQRLVATQEGLPLYEKLGFRAVGEIVQHQGPTPAAVAGSGRVVWGVGAAEMETLADIDRDASGIDRTAMLAALAAAGAVAVLHEGDAPVGYAVLRPFGRGEVVGPVVARDENDARVLIGAAFARSTSGFVRIDTPDKGLGAWLAGQGLAAVGGGVAMRRIPLPRPAASFQTYALASQALG